MGGNAHPGSGCRGHPATEWSVQAVLFLLEADRSITSPAAILLATVSGSFLMIPMPEFYQMGRGKSKYLQYFMAGLFS